MAEVVDLPVARQTAPRWLTAPRRVALVDASIALVVSRAIVWLGGVGAVKLVGFEPNQPRPASVHAFGSGLDLLGAPATAWDATTYLGIADHGYRILYQKAFFPLYPALVKAVTFCTGSGWTAAVAVSLASLFVALYLLHRLVSLELGARYARPAVLLVAFSPMAVFFSAAYPESLVLCLSLGAVYAARRERWAIAGVLGGLAAMSHNAGVLVAVALLAIYLYGPRERARPRYRLRPSALWILCVPAGLAIVLAYMGLHGDVLAPLHAQRLWHRHSVPLGAVWHGIPAAYHGAEQLLVGHGHLRAGSGQFSAADAVARHNLVDFGFLLFAVVATVGVFRRLPIAYGIYSLVALAVVASSYIPGEPLNAFPRHVAVVFPLWMWLAVWAGDGRRRLTVLLLGSAALAVLFSAEFATWRWVA